MILIDDCSKNYIKTQKVKEADVVGAGDTVIAALSLCLASNLDKLLSIQISNIAAKISVSKSATSTVNFDEIEADIINFL
jgi:D-beta-D-heptose 7-phosphate kinase/D-beta-D-heptose 1-phosphate adenosyltransferase